MAVEHLDDENRSECYIKITLLVIFEDRHCDGPGRGSDIGHLHTAAPICSVVPRSFCGCWLT